MKHLLLLALLAIGISASAAPQSLAPITMLSQKSFPADVIPFSELSKTGVKASLFFFVGRQCPVSNSYAPEIERIYKNYASKGVQMRLIYEDAGAQRSDLKTHEAQYGLTLPAGLDERHALAKTLKATVTPEVFVFTTGSLAYRGRIDNKYADFGKVRPQATTHDLRDALDAILAGKPVTHPVTQAIGCFL